MNYYVEFVGGLKDDKVIQKIFAKHYNKMCEYTNEKLPEWNAKFDEIWDGEPITDYSENKAYQKWMHYHYNVELANRKMNKDMFLEYNYDENLQLVGTKRHGKNKGQTISFVLKRA